MGVAVVERVEILDMAKLAATDGVELILHFGGELVVDQRCQVFLKV